MEMQFSSWFGEGSGWLDAAQERNGVCHNFSIKIAEVLVCCSPQPIKALEK